MEALSIVQFHFVANAINNLAHYLKAVFYYFGNSNYFELLTMQEVRNGKGREGNERMPLLFESAAFWEGETRTGQITRRNRMELTALPPIPSNFSSTL